MLLNQTLETFLRNLYGLAFGNNYISGGHIYDHIISLFPHITFKFIPGKWGNHIYQVSEPECYKNMDIAHPDFINYVIKLFYERFIKSTGGYITMYSDSEDYQYLKKYNFISCCSEAIHVRGKISI